MKWWFFGLFVAIILLLFGLHALLYFSFTLSENSYFVSLLLLLPAILLSAYFLLIIVVEPKESQDKKLEHLIKESLHELNLPIATIKANIEMLKRGEHEPKNLKRISRIEASLERFKRLFNTLSYNLKKELLPIKKESVRVDKLIKEHIEEFEQLERNKFIVQLEPLQLILDKIGFEQVVDNILENAIKYSPKESVVKVTLRDKILTIQDNGIGIEPSELPLIYQRYYQGDQGYSGEGIGLAIVKRYCDTQKIDLKIESQKGSGTVVVLDFSAIA